MFTTVLTRVHMMYIQHFLTPVRERPTASIIASVASGTPIGSPLSARLVEVRNSKKQLDKERQILLNRVKYLEV
jgi:hypothetical protein